MRKITIENATEGMILAKPLADLHGKILLAEGSSLTDRLLVRLNDSGCDILYVEGEPESDDEKEKVVGFDLSNQDTEEIFSLIDHRFSHVTDNPVMAKMKAALKEHLLKKSRNHESREERIEASGQPD